MAHAAAEEGAATAAAIPAAPRFSVMTQNGAVSSEPDYVVEMRSGDNVVFEC